MEAQSGADQMKRLHIVYFLSRKEFTEHPHLIRVHHPSNNTVRLQDFKRWLAELRGKDIPESFTWSFKRKYKTGYIWQDLLDDDLVTPISDNELVLKGSEISPTDQSSSVTSINTPTKLSSEIIEESTPVSGSETCTIADVLEQDTISQLGHSSNNKNRKAKKIEETSIGTAMGVASSGKPPFAVSFRKLITCRGVDTKDSAVMTARDKKNRPFSNMCSGYRSTNVRSTNIFRMEMRGVGSDDQTILGKARRTRNQWSYKGKSCDVAKESTKKKGQCREEYKPLTRPKCAQCGKAFKPEKLHSHMKSCKGMKILAKASNHAIFTPAAASAENKPKISTASRNSGLSSSVSGYFRISQ